MRTKTVIFRNIDDMLDFIKKVESYPYHMYMKMDSYNVDAKSLFGLMNLGLGRKIELEVYDENCDDLFEDIAQFVAA